jgi:hypothetical protein
MEMTFFVAEILGFVLLTFYGGYYLPINYVIDRGKYAPLRINIITWIALALYLFLRVNFDFTLFVEFTSKALIDLLSVFSLALTIAVVWVLARRKKYISAFIAFQIAQGIAAIPLLRHVDHLFFSQRT